MTIFCVSSYYRICQKNLFDKGFTFNITHDLNNKVTGIVWMTSYMRDNFERCGNYLSIDVMRSSISNTTEFCYIAPVVLNEIGRINIVCEAIGMLT